MFVGREDALVKIRSQRLEHPVHECIPAARRFVAEVTLPQWESSSSTMVAFLQVSDSAQSAEADSATVTVLPIAAD
jgi:hypothetical protein